MLRCPAVLAIAPDSDPLVLYVSDSDGTGDHRLVRIREQGGNFVQDVVAQMPAGPNGTSAYGIAVSPVTIPEPAADGIAVGALVALAWCSRRSVERHPTR